MIQQDYYYPQDDVLAENWEAPYEDFARLVRCMWIFGSSLFLAGLVFFFLRDLKIAAGICGATAVILTLFHTSFGLFIVFLLFSIENAVVLHPSFTISKVMGIVVLISFLLHAYRIKFLFPAPVKVMFILTFWAFLSAFWAILPSYTALFCLSFLLNIGLLFIFLNTVTDSQSLFVVISGFAVGAAVTSLLLLAGMGSYGTGGGAEELGRTMLHEDASPVILARSISLGFLVAVYAFFQKGYIKKLLAAGLLILFFLALITKTQSRTPTAVACGVPVIAMILCSKSEHKIKYLFLACLLMMISFIGFKVLMQSDLMSYTAKERILSEGFEESGRLTLWRNGFRWFLRRPIHGYGLQNFHLIGGESGGVSAHNNIVAMATELGLVGLSLFAVIFVLLYQKIRKMVEPKLKWLAAVMLLYPFLTGMTSTTYTKKDFWYALSISVVAISIARKREEEAQIQMDYWDDSEPEMTNGNTEQMESISLNTSCQGET